MLSHIIFATKSYIVQKLDFISNLEIIASRLKSRDIVVHFLTSFNAPNTSYNYRILIPILFASKSNYDQIKSNSQFNEILKSLNAQDIYSEDNLSLLTQLLTGTNPPTMLTNSTNLRLFNFHHTILSVLNLSKDILQNTQIDTDLNKDIENGIIVFQVLIAGEGLNTDGYIKILSAIEDLVSKVSKITGDENQSAEVILLDSGSDTNIGIKTGVETAKSLFLIFKEVWDFIANRKFYDEKRNQQALLDSLAIREVIKQKVDAGVLTEAEGMEYAHVIKSRTNDLIGMKVLPKQIVMDSVNYDNKKMLIEFEGFKQLGQGDKE